MSSGLAASLLGLVGIPLIGAAVSVLGGRRRAAGVAAVAAALTAGASVVVTVGVWRAGPIRYALGGWPAPLGIPLTCDGPRAALLVTIAGVCAAIIAYLGPYLRAMARSNSGSDEPRRWQVWPLLLGAWAGVDAALIAGDLFNLYVAVELIGLSSIALVAVTGDQARVAALRYVLVTMAGSLLYLLGVALIYAEHGVVDLAVVASRLRATGPGPATLAAWVAFLGALLSKAAFVPFHVWLPPAHASALPPISALLSGVVVEAFFLVLLRVWSGLFAENGDPAGFGGVIELLGLLGVVAIVWGSVQAWAAARLELLIAYSTVAQLGYLLLGFPLARANPAAADTDAGLPLAWRAVVVFVITHALAKAGAFLAAGALDRVHGGDALDRLRGAATVAPLACLGFALAGVALVGLPPSGSFVAKWMLLDAAIAGGRWGYVAVIVAGSLLSAAYVGRVVTVSLRARPDDAPAPERVPARLSALAFALGLAAASLGFAAAPLLDLLGRDVGGP